LLYFWRSIKNILSVNALLCYFWHVTQITIKATAHKLGKAWGWGNPVFFRSLDGWIEVYPDVPATARLDVGFLGFSVFK
jgi:hypothetical protein